MTDKHLEDFITKNLYLHIEGHASPVSRLRRICVPGFGCISEFRTYAWDDATPIALPSGYLKNAIFHLDWFDEDGKYQHVEANVVEIIHTKHLQLSPCFHWKCPKYSSLKYAYLSLRVHEYLVDLWKLEDIFLAVHNNIWDVICKDYTRIHFCVPDPDFFLNKNYLLASIPKTSSGSSHIEISLNLQEYCGYLQLPLLRCRSNYRNFLINYARAQPLYKL